MNFLVKNKGCNKIGAIVEFFVEFNLIFFVHFVLKNEENLYVLIEQNVLP